MTITNIINRINRRLGDSAYSYDELWGSLDATINELNWRLRLDLPLITDSPEMKRDMTTGQTTAVDYPNLPTEWITGFVVPFCAAKKLDANMNGEDNRPEYAEAEMNFSMLTARYPGIVDSGRSEITKADMTLLLLAEDTSDQFADGHGNFSDDYDPFSNY